MWINVYKWMEVKEGFWGQSKRLPFIKNTYRYGNVSECYMTGTLDLKKRVMEFFQEYIDYLRTKDQPVMDIRNSIKRKQ